MISKDLKKEFDKNAYLSEVLQSNSPLSKKEYEPIQKENTMIWENQDELVTFEELGGMTHQVEEGCSLAFYSKKTLNGS